MQDYGGRTGPGWDCGRCRLNGPNNLLLHCRFYDSMIKGQFIMANQPNPHMIGLWEGTGAPERNPRDTGRMCKLHTDSDPRPELNPGPWRREAAVLTTVPHLVL